MELMHRYLPQKLQIQIFDLNSCIWIFRAELENIFYNIAQTDFAAGHWNESVQHIQARIQMNQSEESQLVGLRALKELVRAF